MKRALGAPSISMTIGLLIVGCALALAALGPSGVALAASDSSNALSIVGDFGLSREPITRTRDVNLCPTPAIGAYPECEQPAESEASASGLDRPAVLSALVSGDLLGPGGENQFPAKQVAVTAANVGRQGLEVSVVADPLTPSEVHPGQYTGQIVIERTSGPPVVLDLVLRLEQKTGWSLASFWAVVALGVGAVLGGLIKWLNETMAPLSGLWRRWRRLRRRLAPHWAGLPEDARSQLVDARTSIQERDASDVGALLDAFAQQQSGLIAFSRALADIKEHLDEQTRELSRLPHPVAYQEAALQTQRNAIKDLNQMSWPWPPPIADFEKKYQALKENIRLISRNVQDYTATPNSQSQLQLESRFVQVSTGGASGLLSPLSSPMILSQTGQLPELLPLGDPMEVEQLADMHLRSDQGMEPPSDRNEGIERVLNTTPFLVSFGTGLVVVFAGYLTQFADAAAFSGGLDYLKLVAWTFAAEVTGVTLLDLAGQLKGSAPAAPVGAP